MFAIGDDEWAGLSKLMEEAGEVLQVGGKLMGSRGSTDHWSGDLRDKFIEELGDLRAAIEFFSDMNFSEDELAQISARALAKYQLFHQWQTS